ncbi:MAG: hypothetical protein PUH01_02475 [Pseudomonadota bacterium]|nr:hypothetical protein [Pseudomonadota bacterium]
MNDIKENDNNTINNVDNVNNSVDFKQEEKNNILNFIKTLPQILMAQTLKDNYRVTPQGLFINLKETKNFTSLFAKSTNTPENKVIKKLFNEESLPVYYLLEGKSCQTGNLVPLNINEPQQFKMPYYLGTLTNARDYLYPQDPEILAINDLKINGNNIEFKKGNFTYTLSQDLLKRFNHFIDFSPMISKRFSNSSKSLKESLKAFIFFFKKARFVHSPKKLLVPQKCKDNKNNKFMILDSLVFIFNKDNVMQDFYEAKGKNLYHFMRSEFEKIKPYYRSEKVGTFKPFPSSNKFLGVYTLNKKSSMLNPFAFFNFLETAPLMKSMEHYFMKTYSVKDAFEIFSYLFINAAPIEAKNIKNYIEKLSKYSCKYLINQQWIFGLDNKDNLTTCIAKGSKK